MTREEFEVCRNDPYRAFDAAQQKIRELQQRVTVAKNINRTLLADPKYQFGQAVQNFERLKAEHIQLNDAYNDLEAVNESLQEVTEVLRGDKHQLLIELNAVKREIAIQGIENQQLELKARQLRAFTDTIDLKLRSNLLSSTTTKKKLPTSRSTSRTKSSRLRRRVRTCPCKAAASRTCGSISTPRELPKTARSRPSRGKFRARRRKWSSTTRSSGSSSERCLVEF